MTNERGSVWIAMEAILILIYACNSYPIPGMDLSCSFVTVGCEFQFPIDFSAVKHSELTSAPATIKSYLKDLAAHLQASSEIAIILVEEQHAWHHEFINARQPDPKVCFVDNIVFACWAIQSGSSQGRVNKFLIHSQGPNILLPAFMVHLMKSNTVPHRNKRRGTHPIFHQKTLSFFPYIRLTVLIISLAKSKKISDDPYMQVGITRFKPPTPFWASANFLSAKASIDYHWPT